jgi:polysaccharide biosynthesis protein PslH
MDVLFIPMALCPPVGRLHKSTDYSKCTCGFGGMRILVLSKRPFDERLGDFVRVINIARILQVNHRLDLLSFEDSGQRLGEEARSVFDTATMLPFPRTSGRPLLQRARAALSLSSVAPVSSAMQSALAEVFKLRSHDIVLSVGGSVLLNLPSGRRGIPIVTDSIDSASLTFAREWKHARFRERPRLLRQMWLYRQLAHWIARNVDANVFASELDASIAARRFPRLRTEGIPNGVDAEFYCPGPSAPEPKSIVFEGNMMFGPNVDAARYLCEIIVPRILGRHPDLRVYVVGRDPVPQVRALASKSIVVTGTVPDVRDYLWRSSVFVCPMRLGAGIKNKVLQAWAVGMPVVATSEALGGLDARDGENVLVRDAPSLFADTVTELLSDPARGRAVAEGGRKTAVEHYSWRAQARRFELLFEELIARAAK